MNDRCRACKYGTGIKRTLVCDYFLKTGQPRGCPTGDACDKWEEKTNNKGKELWKKMK